MCVLLAFAFGQGFIFQNKANKDMFTVIVIITVIAIVDEGTSVFFLFF